MPTDTEAELMRKVGQIETSINGIDERVANIEKSLAKFSKIFYGVLGVLVAHGGGLAYFLQDKL